MPAHSVAIETEKTRRVIIIDDDRDFAEGLDVVLGSEGYEVALAHDGAAAERVLSEFTANVALIDVRLGRDSGLDLIGRIRRQHPKLLYVVITGFASIDTAIQAVQEGAYDYLCKPIEPDQLLTVLDRSFERISLQNKKAVAEALLRQRNDELEQINRRLRQVVHSMWGFASDAEMQTLYPRLLEEVARGMAADGGAVYLIEAGQLVLKHALDPGHAPAVLPLPLDDATVFGRALHHQEPVLVRQIDAANDVPRSGWPGYRDSSLLAFPLIGKDDDECLGVMSLHSKNNPPFTEQDREIGQILISFVCETLRGVMARESLAGSETRYRSLVENCPLSILEFDLAGTLLSVNRAGFLVLGLKSDDELRVAKFRDFVSPGDWERVQEMFASAKMGNVSSFEFSLEADGGSTVHMASFAPVMSGRGEVQGIICFAQDVSEQKQADERLRQAQKIEALGQLTGGVAHDFNNLLAVILGNAELIRDGGEGEANGVENVIRAATAGAELTRSLLAFARQQPLCPQALDVGSMLAGMSNMLVRTLGETIEIRTSCAPELWFAVADAGQVENALLNLAINARDAMPNGGTLVIELANATTAGDPIAQDVDVAAGDYVVLSVTDDGIGMTRDVLDRVFDPFFTTKGVGEGSGLGLSMVHGFAKQTGGHVSVASEIGKGATFKLFLPRAEAPDATPEATEASVPRGQGEKILVVEDNQDVRSLIATILDRLGYEVIDAEDGESALSVARDTPDIDLLVSDVVLPGGMSGLDVARKLRQQYPGLKVVYVSGYTSAEIDRHGELPRHEVLLMKPFRKAELARTLRAQLDR